MTKDILVLHHKPGPAIHPFVYDLCHREKVRMVGLCPWFVNTELVRSQLHSLNEVEEKYKIRSLETQEVIYYLFYPNCYKSKP